MKNGFEDFLMEQHAEQYVGTGDMMIDDFNDWVTDLDVEELIKFGDKFVNAELAKQPKVMSEEEKVTVINKWLEKYNIVSYKGLAVGIIRIEEIDELAKALSGRVGKKE